jgi:hypothetical protein
VRALILVIISATCLLPAAVGTAQWSGFQTPCDRAGASVVEGEGCRNIVQFLPPRAGRLREGRGGRDERIFDSPFEAILSIAFGLGWLLVAVRGLLTGSRLGRGVPETLGALTATGAVAVSDHVLGIACLVAALLVSGVAVARAIATRSVGRAVRRAVLAAIVVWLFVGLGGVLPDAGWLAWALAPAGTALLLSRRSDPRGAGEQAGLGMVGHSSS